LEQGTIPFMETTDLFGIRIKQDEAFAIIAKHLESLGYIVKLEDISIVPLTNNKVEFIIRHFEKK
jgi:hypothetical protein